MKQFIKNVLASTVGVVIGSLILTFLGIVTLIGVAVGNSEPTARLTEGSVLTVKLYGDISERNDDNIFASALGQADLSQSLNDIVAAIDKAAETEEVKVIYLDAGIVSSSYASLREIREALERAKAKKKTIVSYGKTYSQGAYYVSSVADHVYVHPEGSVDLHGIAAETMYVKDLLKKFGVDMTVLKVGKYKSFTEQYTEDQMSEANREQTQRYISGIWNDVTGAIAKSRKIKTDEVNACADSLATLQDVNFLLRHKLVSKTFYAEDVDDELKKLAGVDKDAELNKLTCSAMNTTGATMMTSGDEIAVYYLEGSIVRSSEASLGSTESTIVSTKVVKDLMKLKDDENVKAVVLRVNSGGGDAFASEEIWHAVKGLKEKKPVVVSMGGAAASGAYYLSAAATTIVAQPTTLTGSIGIFGVIPNLSVLTKEKLGLKFDVVKTNAHSDFNFMQTARSFNPEETALLQQYINRGYELFVKRVADGRKLPADSVKAIAQGRVWLGMDAVKIGLVDKLGGKDVAIKTAAKAAKVEDYNVKDYPAPLNWMEQLTETMDGTASATASMRELLGEMYEPFVTIKSLEKQSPVQMRAEYMLLAK